MDDLLETDDSFEVVASTMKAIYDQTCRSCGLINSMLIYMPQKDDTVVRKLRIDHKLGDTKAKLKYIRPDKRQSDFSETVSETRQQDESSWPRRQWEDRPCWQREEERGASSSSSWNWGNRSW